MRDLELKAAAYLEEVLVAATTKTIAQVLLAQK